MLKKKNLILFSSATTLVVVALSVYFGVFFSANYTITINSIAPQDLGVDEWLEDFEYLYNYISENYPYLQVKNRTHGYNWLDLKDTFVDRINTAADNEEFFKIITEAVIALQNRHTFVLYPGKVIDNFNTMQFYPAEEVFTQEVADAASYWNSIFLDDEAERLIRKFDVLIVYEKGEYVIHDYNSSWETTYGNETVVTHVNGVPVDEAILTSFDTAYIDYDFSRGKNYVWSIYPRHFGADAEFTILNSTGYSTDVSFGIESELAVHPYQYPSTAVNLTTYDADKIGYMYVSKFYGTEVENSFPDILDFYLDIEDYDNLIIDIRGNTGGFYSFWIDGIVQHFLESQTVFEFYNAYRTGDYVEYLHQNYLTAKMSKKDFPTLPPEVETKDFEIYKFWQTINPSEHIDFNGNITLLIDNMVFSAAEGFLHFCRKYDFVDNIYGTPSGGDGLMIWPLYIVLPNSKLVINAASSLGIDHNGFANEEVRTQPDVLYESSYGNWDELINLVIDDLTI